MENILAMLTALGFAVYGSVHDAQSERAHVAENMNESRVSDYQWHASVLKQRAVVYAFLLYVAATSPTWPGSWWTIFGIMLAAILHQPVYDYTIAHLSRYADGKPRPQWLFALRDFTRWMFGWLYGE